MGMVFTLRIMSELAFYFYFASFVGGLLGMESAPVIPFLIIILCCGVSWSLSKSKWAVARMAPFCLLLLCAFFINHLIDFFVVLPAIIYAVYTCYKRLFDMGRDFNNWFLRVSKIMLLLLVFAIFPEKNQVSIGHIIPENNYVNSFSASFGLMFLFISVYLMRILRHDEETIKQLRLRLFNAAVLAGVGGVGFVLSIDVTYKTINSVILFVYNEIIVPIFAFILYVLNLILRYLPSFIDTINQMDSEKLLIEPEIPIEDMQVDSEKLPTLDSLYLSEIFKLLVIITALVVLFLLFKHMLGKKSSISVSAGATEIRSPLNVKPPPRHKRIFALGARDSRERIRAVYRKFLTLCSDNGISAAPCDTSLSIHNRVAADYWCQEKDAWELRELYITARYSEHEVEQDDVRSMKKRFASVRANSANRSK